MKPHKHAEVIKAWADNPDLTIQFRASDSKWLDVCGEPAWIKDNEYRIKPEPPAKVYPVTGMTKEEMLIAWAGTPYPDCHYTHFANAALRHAVDSGQLVEPPQPGSVIAILGGKEYHAAIKRNAARDMAIAEAVQGACQEVIWRHEKKYNALHRTSLGVGIWMSMPYARNITLALEDIIATVKESP